MKKTEVIVRKKTLELREKIARLFNSVMDEIDSLFNENKGASPVLSQVFEQAQKERRIETELDINEKKELIESFKDAKAQYDLAVQDLNFAEQEYIPAAIIKITAAQMRCDVIAQEIKRSTGLDVNPIARNIRERTLRVYDK